LAIRGSYATAGVMVTGVLLHGVLVTGVPVNEKESNFPVKKDLTSVLYNILLWTH